MSMWVVTAANFINNVKNLDVILDTRKKTKFSTVEYEHKTRNLFHYPFIVADEL